jgi:succinate dehydrogenase / fumarate reductase iron-sulfur subunit
MSMDTTTTRPTETRRFRVFRYRRGDERGRYDQFDVPIAERTTVIEALRQIRLRQDPTLTIRHSCLHASCGTCGVRVNGREVLGCVTVVRDLPAGTILVEPMANLPVVTDLVVHMPSFYERFGPAQAPLIRESEFLPQAQTPEGIAAYGRYEDCIECGLCLSACPIAGTNDRYLGPAALAAAQRLTEEPRGTDLVAALDHVDAEHGIWRCHMTFECTEACPSNVRPGQRIMTLRGLVARDRFRRLAGGEGYGERVAREEEAATGGSDG